MYRTSLSMDLNIVEEVPETDQDSQSGNSESTLSNPSVSEDSGDSVSSDSPRDCEETDGGDTNLAFEGSFEKGEGESQTDTHRKKEVVLSVPDSTHSNIELKTVEQKKDPICDVEGGETRKQEYGEYFIPFDEKNESFRGEKLYVTKTRDSKGRCRRLCCWLFALTILAGAIAVAVMIGTGIIDVSSPRRIKEGRKINTKDPINDLQLLEVKHPDAPNILTNDPDFFKKTVRDIPPSDSVPNAFTGEFKITNMKWNEALHDKSSPEFQKLSVQLKDDIHSLFADIYSEEAANLFVKITKFNPGSVIVSYTVGLVVNNNTILTVTNIREKILSKVISGEEEMFIKYSIASDSVSFSYMKDKCSLLNCTHKCQYSYPTHTFICQCPDKMEPNSEGICVNLQGIVLESTSDDIPTIKPAPAIKIPLEDIIPNPPAEHQINITQENKISSSEDTTIASDVNENLAIVSDSYEDNIDTKKISVTVSMVNTTPKSAVILFNQITITNSLEAKPNETKHESKLFNETLYSTDSFNSTIGITQSTSTTEKVAPNTSQPAETEPESKYNETKPESNSFNKILDIIDSLSPTMESPKLRSTPEKVAPNTRQPAETKLDSNTIRSIDQTQDLVENTIEALVGASDETTLESNYMVLGPSGHNFTDGKLNFILSEPEGTTYSTGLSMTTVNSTNISNNSSKTTISSTEESSTQIPSLDSPGHTPTLEVGVLLLTTPTNIESDPMHLTTQNQNVSWSQNHLNISTEDAELASSMPSTTEKDQFEQLVEGSGVSENIEGSTDDEENLSYQLKYTSTDTPKMTKEFEEEQLFIDNNIEICEDEKESSSETFESDLIIYTNITEATYNLTETDMKTTRNKESSDEKEDTTTLAPPADIRTTRIAMNFSSENTRGEKSTENIFENQSTLIEEEATVRNVIDSDIIHLFSLDLKSDTSQDHQKNQFR